MHLAMQLHIYYVALFFCGVRSFQSIFVSHNNARKLLQIRRETSFSIYWATVYYCYIFF